MFSVELMISYQTNNTSLSKGWFSSPLFRFTLCFLACLAHLDHHCKQGDMFSYTDALEHTNEKKAFSSLVFLAVRVSGWNHFSYFSPIRVILIFIEK
jgi:hypothetical protein